MADLVDDLNRAIRDVPDFPKPGIMFKDITPVLTDPGLLQRVIHRFANVYGDREIDVVCGIESRGFIFGAPLALALGKPFALARKPGKLPYRKLAQDYALEYGTATLEMHTDAVALGQRVVVVDDLLATGGTAAASRQLITQLGGVVVGFAFVIELTFLHGREQLTPVPCESIVSY